MPSTQNHPSPATRYNARLGVVLFLIYLAVYATYVGLSAFRGDLMKKPVIAGVNLAIVYGFGLILLAFGMAILYMVLCKPSDEGDVL
jgi:uncharacterized membrane protein (DUF485 family)